MSLYFYGYAPSLAKQEMLQMVDRQIEPSSCVLSHTPSYTSDLKYKISHLDNAY